MATHVEKHILLMVFREEEKEFQVSMGEPDFREALMYFDGAALVTSNSARKKRS